VLEAGIKEFEKVQTKRLFLAVRRGKTWITREV